MLFLAFLVLAGGLLYGYLMYKRSFNKVKEGVVQLTQNQETESDWVKGYLDKYPFDFERNSGVIKDPAGNVDQIMIIGRVESVTDSAIQVRTVYKVFDVLVFDSTIHVQGSRDAGANQISTIEFENIKINDDVSVRCKRGADNNLVALEIVKYK